MAAIRQCTTLPSSGIRSALEAGLTHTRAILSAKTERERAQRDALAAFAIRIASAALLYLSQVALARWMGAGEYGVYVVAWTTVLVLGGLSSVGLNQAVIRLVPEYREGGRIGLLRGLVSGSRRVAFFVGSLVAVAGLAGVWLLGSFIDNVYIVPAYLALVCLPMYALTDVQDGIGRGRGWMGVGLVPPYVLRPLLVLAAMAVAHATALPMTAATAVASAIVATWVTGLLQLWALGRALSPELREAAPATDWRSWLGISLPLMAITGAEIALQCADVLVLSRWMSSADVAVYYAAAKTMSLILYVHYAVGSAAANRVAGLAARGDRTALAEAVAESVRWTFWPSLAAGVAIVALGVPLLSLFGSEFTAGYPVMLVLVLGFLARAAVGPSDMLLRMLGEHNLSAAVSVGTAVLNVTLLLLLVPHFGLIGAAIATALALALEAYCNWTVARRRLGLDIGIWQTVARD